MTTLEHKPVAPPPDAIRAIEDPRARFDAVDPARQAHLDAIAELARIPREIVAELRTRGLAYAAIGGILGITRQRAQQLAMSDEEVAAAAERAHEITQERMRQRELKREAETKKVQGMVVRLRARGLTHAAVADKLDISISRSQQLAAAAARAAVTAEVEESAE